MPTVRGFALFALAGPTAVLATSKLVLEGAAGAAEVSNVGGTLTLAAPKCVDMSNFCENAHTDCKSSFHAPASSVEFSSTAPGHSGNTAYLSLYDDGVLGFRFSDHAEATACVELEGAALALATATTSTNSLALAGAGAAAPMAGVELRPAPTRANARVRAGLELVVGLLHGVPESCYTPHTSSWGAASPATQAVHFFTR